MNRWSLLLALPAVSDEKPPYSLPARAAKVVVSACSQDGLITLVDEIQQAGGTAIAVPADVSALLIWGMNVGKDVPLRGTSLPTFISGLSNADVSEFEQVKAIADKTVDYFGRLDIWVHAAATAVFATFDNIAPDEFKRVIDVNLNGQA